MALPHDSPAKSDIGQEPKAFATAIVRKLFVQDDQARRLPAAPGHRQDDRGPDPAEVRTALKTANAAVAPRPLDILLLTEEPYVPWELAWIDQPFDKTAPPYLGAQANVGRWVLDGGATPTDPPRQVDAATMAVVWGVYHSASLPPLAAAEAEAKKIQKLYGATSIDAAGPRLRLLGGVPPADILHFAVHGRYDPLGAGDGIYLVEGPPIDPFQIRGSDLSKPGTVRLPQRMPGRQRAGAPRQLRRDRPAFLQVGASAVVAPLWSIDDEIAQQIALEFYHQALAPADAKAEAKADGHAGGDATPGATGDAPAADAGRAVTTDRPAVADLLRRARAGLVQNAAAQSSTYLAYQFYGHPSLRLSWHGEPPREDTTMADLDPSGQTIQLGELGLRTRGSPGPPTRSTRGRAPGSVRPAGQAASSRQLWTGLRWRRPTLSRSRQPRYRARPMAARGRTGGARRDVELDVPQPPKASSRRHVGRRGRGDDLVVRTGAGSRPPPDTRRDRNT